MTLISKQKELFELMLTHVSDDFTKGLFIDKQISLIKEIEQALLQPDVIKSGCIDCGEEFEPIKRCTACENNKGLPM